MINLGFFYLSIPIAVLFIFLHHLSPFCTWRVVVSSVKLTSVRAVSSLNSSTSFSEGLSALSMPASGSVIPGYGTGQRLAEQKHSRAGGWSWGGVSNAAPALPPSPAHWLVCLLFSPPSCFRYTFSHTGPQFPPLTSPPAPQGSLVGTYWSVWGTAQGDMRGNCNYFSSINVDIIDVTCRKSFSTVRFVLFLQDLWEKNK